MTAHEALYEALVKHATRMARENHFRYAVLAKRWPRTGWSYHVVAVGSAGERSLRHWRKIHEQAQRRG
jgi:hypothetical protein